MTNEKLEINGVEIRHNADTAQPGQVPPVDQNNLHSLIRVSRVVRSLKAGINMYTAMMPVEKVPDLMEPQYWPKKTEF